MSSEISLLNIVSYHPYLMVTYPHIQLGMLCCPMQLIEQLINDGYEMFLDSHLVQDTIIYKTTMNHFSFLQEPMTRKELLLGCITPLSNISFTILSTFTFWLWA